MGASSTLTQIRQFVAIEMGGQGLGGFHSSNATGGSATTLVDTSWPTKSTLVLTVNSGDFFLCICNHAIFLRNHFSIKN